MDRWGGKEHWGWVAVPRCPSPSIIIPWSLHPHSRPERCPGDHQQAALVDGLAGCRPFPLFLNTWDPQVIPSKPAPPASPCDPYPSPIAGHIAVCQAPVRVVPTAQGIAACCPSIPSHPFPDCPALPCPGGPKSQARLSPPRTHRCSQCLPSRTRTPPSDQRKRRAPKERKGPKSWA